MNQPRILFIQLPVQSHDYHYNLAHVPLASGVLASFLKQHLPNVDIVLPDALLTSSASTSTLINHILHLEPDIVAFGCYLWNIERSLFIARSLRQKGLKALMISGGPEIHPDHHLLADPDCPFDMLVTGEGEDALRQIVYAAISEKSDLKKGFFIKSTPVSPAEIPSPYLTGFLSPPLEGSLLIETSRGCPYHCAYCYYHHNVPRIAEFPIDRTVQEIMWARQHNVKEITFADPSFSSRRNLAKLLDVLSELNSDGFFSFSAELNAELCNEELARKLAQAGFKHVEVGLQSTNPATLRAIGRPVKLDAFVRGVKALRKYGISVMVDLIVGLPEETPESFAKAVDFCVTEDLADELSIYPLSILPGTELRNHAAKLGIVYDPVPPYYVRKTPWMDEEAIYQMFRYAEDITGIDYFPPEFPRLHPISENPLLCVESLTTDDDITRWCQTIMENPFLGQAVTFKLENEKWWLYQEELSRLLLNLLNRDPFILVSWIIPEETIANVPINMRLKLFETFLSHRSHYKDREWFSTSSSLKSSQVFVQISHQTGLSSTFLWVTPELLSGQHDELWFLTPQLAAAQGDNSSFPEKYILYRSTQLLGVSHDVPYRVTFI